MKISRMSMNDSQWAVLIGLGLAAAVYCFYSFIFLPQQADIEDLKMRRQQVQIRLKAIQDFENSHANLDEYLYNLETKKGELAKALPENNDMRDFLLQVERAAKDGQVSLERVKYANFAGENGYSEMPVEIVVKGSYFQILRFIKLLENTPRFTAMQKLAVKVDIDSIECTITTKVYMYGLAKPSKQDEKKPPGRPSAKSN